MGKKGSKRKTRWRTLSIGAPPGEEDEEEGGALRNGIGSRGQENGPRNFDKSSGQNGYKPRRSGNNGTTGSSGYGSASSRRRDAECPDPEGKNKIIFNEDEYTRITTPRQDVLFKKGYLARKKPWPGGNASTSATPSTAESQSASHSTADGSETTEDQQLLDKDYSVDYPAVIEGPPQVSYGTFYDHASGYYYEYPVMLVGPAMPGQMPPPNVMAGMSCAPVPLRPIEWVNPAFVPKLSGQQYCMMDCMSSQGSECATLVDAQGNPLEASAGKSNGNESGTGSVSCNGSVTGGDEHMDAESQSVQSVAEPLEEEEEEVEVEQLPNGPSTTFHEQPPPVIPAPPPPLHLMPQLPPPPPPYIYPGHYMFGPSLIDVNGVTVQSAPMIRIGDAMVAANCVKRRKKRKKRKQRKFAQGNGEAGEEEEEEYSSECENGMSSRRLSWSEVAGSQQSSSLTNSNSNNRPLNPECQEFKLRATSPPLPCDESDAIVIDTAVEALQTLQLDNNDLTTTAVDVVEKMTLKDSIHPSPLLQSTATDDNKRLNLTLDPSTSSTAAGEQRAVSPEINRTTTPINVDTQRLPDSYESLLTKPNTSKRKYTRITRELTPGPDLDCCSAGGGPPVELAEIAGEETNEDSGFESQSSRRSDKPLTEAVRQWLSNADHQDELFVNPGSLESDDEESSSDDEQQQPKNLQGNPMPALSVNEREDIEVCRAERRRKSKMKQSPRDSVAGVRVAKHKNRMGKEKEEFIVKTFERGEIAICQDGRAVLNRNDNNTGRQSLALVGIDEESVDVMEFWEAETVPAAVRPIEEVELQFERTKKYYTLLSRSTPERAGDSMLTREEKTVPKNRHESAVADNFYTEESSEELRAGKVQAEEAIEVYESCYNGQAFASLQQQENIATGKPSVGCKQQPCRVVCCNLQ